MSKILEAREKAKAEHSLRDGVLINRAFSKVSEKPADQLHPSPTLSRDRGDFRPTGDARAKKSIRSVSFHPEEHLVSLVAPDSFEAEQYRTLRAMIEQRHRDADLSVIAVTSPGVGEGKTTTAINLAGALAQDAGARVLLVSADLRKPALGRYLGFRPAPGRGLAQLVTDPTLALEDVVADNEQFNLSVLPASGPSPAPYEVLSSPRFEDLLKEARVSYHYVVIDAPPLLGCPDCRLIGRFVDGILVVVAANKTTRSQVDDALDSLLPDKLLGVVFNGDTRVPKYARGYYKSHRKGKRRK